MDLEAESAERARGAGAPERPCPELVEARNLTHLPFARWCSVCVRSRAADRPQQRQEARSERVIPVVE
eukprot:499314-Alexandrium_andersonii.AAC.1